MTSKVYISAFQETVDFDSLKAADQMACQNLFEIKMNKTQTFNHFALVPGKELMIPLADENKLIGLLASIII